MKIVVAGGSGLIGRALVRSLLVEGHDVVVVTRRPGGRRQARSCGWDDVGAEVDGAAAVVNLAGATIGGRRWTSGRKQTIRASRVETTRTLAAAIEAAAERPHAFVTASGIGYYGDAGDTVVDEDAPPGSDFLAHVCVEWEAAAAGAPTRHVAVRTAFVIGPGATALRLMALPYRLFLGGPLGGGRQWFPWIQLDDLVAVYRLAIGEDGPAGPVNAVAPQQLRQREVADAHGRRPPPAGGAPDAGGAASASGPASRPTSCCTASARSRAASTGSTSATGSSAPRSADALRGAGRRTR